MTLRALATVLGVVAVLLPAAVLPAGKARANDRWLDYFTEASEACGRRDWPEAQRRFLDALAVLPVEEADGRRARDTHHRLGLAYANDGDAARAEEEYLNALGEGARSSPPFDDPSARIGYATSLAILYETLGEWGSAEARREQIVEIARTRMNPAAHAIALANLARLHARLGDAGRALAEHRSALDLLERSGGPPELLAEQHEALGALLRDAGRFAEAQAAYAAALASWRALGEPATFVFAKALAGHAELLRRSGRPDEARDELERALALAERLWDDDPITAGEFGATYVALLTELGERARDPAKN